MPRLTAPVLPAGSWGEGRQPSIEGEDLLLRPWRAGDESFLLEAYSDPAIRRWHTFGMTAVAEAEEFIARHAQRWQREEGADWAVTGAGKQLGRIGFRLLDLEFGDAEVAYWVTPAARNQRVASRALAVLTDWARTAGMHRLTLQHSTLNEASCRVARRGGFALEGVAVRALLHDDGWHDVHLHARLLE